MAHDKAVECSGLTRHFRQRTAVKDLQLEIYNEEIFGLLGHDGAGKTTTLRLLLGLLRPSAGTIRVLGYSMPRQGDIVRAKAGAVLENHGLYLKLNAWDNLQYYGQINKLSKREIENRIQYWLEMVDLWVYRAIILLVSLLFIIISLLSFKKETILDR
ncbi:MAG TPA: ATP-binding cassette domain-containing protein [Syntrophomonadaceae bacterium]|nr:ATP-binding cassette domain-containing protein [Syntrophomonadaceae bacterium]